MKHHYPHSLLTLTWTLLGLLLPLFAFAQPENDECENSIEVIDITNTCFEELYSNEGATPTGFTGGGGLSNDGRDVWFRFTALASDLTITVRGGGEVGTTLDRPEVELFVDNGCEGSFNILESVVGDGAVAELYQGGLFPGGTYLFRVQGRNRAEGTFQLCINNYFPPEEPGGDLVLASMLCDKTPFVIQLIDGTGADPDEAAGTCLDISGSGISSEQSSTWFTWIAENDGTLEFTLDPLNPSDDLDFVVYELPRGINDTRDKEPLRCMATACLGPTGLSSASSDTVEDLGCDPGEDGFVRAIDMEEGKAYGLLINNFSESGNGFSITFGGTGNFQGPEPAVEAMIDGRVIVSEEICAGEQVEFSGANSSFILGEIVAYEWIFGVGANPATGTGVNPGVVTYDEPGTKSVVLTITTDLGCKISEVREAVVIVRPCCEEDNFILGDASVTDVVCGDQRGGIEFSATSNSPIRSYEWNDGINLASRPNLEVGEYIVTVTNLATCKDTFMYQVDSIPPFTVDTILTPPQCNGGTDGAIELVVNSETPVTFVWANGRGTSNSINGLSVGVYNATIVDANGCRDNYVIDLKELELALDPVIEAVTDPLCFGGQGSIEVDITNGTGPFQYNYNDGRGLISANSLRNISADTYIVNVEDANACKGVFEFMVADPPALNLSLDAENISCSGQQDGRIDAAVEGGTGDYNYDWSNNQNRDSITNLTSGTYTLTVTDENDCVITEMASIIEPSDINLAIARILDARCFGEASGAVEIDVTGGSPAFEYSIDDGPFQDSPILMDLAAETYAITVRDSRGCSDDIEATVREPEELVVELFSSTDVVDLGRSTDLETAIQPAFINVDYAWSPPALVSCENCPSPTVSPVLNTTFIVTVTDEADCTATDSLFLRVDPNRDIFIPNAFSPGFDGINDEFNLYGGISAAEISEIRVFDRWGNLIYTASGVPLGNSGLGWDGQYKGRDVPSGVYAFYAKVLFIDGAVVDYEGDVTVLR